MIAPADKQAQLFQPEAVIAEDVGPAGKVTDAWV